jgi:hypothetical protein
MHLFIASRAKSTAVVMDMEQRRNDLVEPIAIQARGEATTEELIAERRLWRAVIVHAVDEWLSGPLRAKRAAQKFLFEDHDDFCQVCACAGLDG